MALKRNGCKVLLSLESCCIITCLGQNANISLRFLCYTTRLLKHLPACPQGLGKCLKPRDIVHLENVGILAHNLYTMMQKKVETHDVTLA